MVQNGTQMLVVVKITMILGSSTQDRKFLDKLNAVCFSRTLPHAVRSSGI